jgi:hypothetical protein
MTVILGRVLQNQILFHCYIPPLDTMLYQQRRKGPAESTELGTPWWRHNPPPEIQNITFYCGFFQNAIRSTDRMRYSDRSGSKFANKYRGPLNIESYGGGGPRPVIYLTAVTYSLYTFIIIIPFVCKFQNLCLALKLSDKISPCLTFYRRSAVFYLKTQSVPRSKHFSSRL